MSAAAPTSSPSIEITIRELLPSGKSRFVSRWVRHGPKGWASGDNLGRDHVAHSDEPSARKHLAGWMRSQANAFGVAEADPAAEDESDLIG